MKITEQDVQRVAELANLALTAEEITRMTRDLDGILGHIDKLNELDTTNVEPMAQVLFEAGATATLRPDVEVTPAHECRCHGQRRRLRSRIFQSAEGHRPEVDQ